MSRAPPNNSLDRGGTSGLIVDNLTVGVVDSRPVNSNVSPLLDVEDVWWVKILVVNLPLQ